MPDVMIPFAEYGIAIFSIMVLVWIVSQVFKVITNNTRVLTQLSVLISQQHELIKDLYVEITDLRLADAYRQWVEQREKKE